MRACFERRASFTPPCCSVDGVMGKEAEHFMKIMADRLAVKWERRYSEVMRWIRTRLSFAILCATIIVPERITY